jgi:signal transduction histidine kinase
VACDRTLEALVDVDAVLLRQAVTDVLSNACKYSRGKSAFAGPTRGSA